MRHYKKIDEFWQYCCTNQYFNIGYPESADFDYTDLYRFFNFSINNCGNWQEPSNYALNTFDFEKDVIKYFSDLFKIPFDDSWGYVTHGGTEGNLFGCYLAREIFPNATLYYSSHAHYSVHKIAKILKMSTCIINVLENGEMDYADLINKISANNEKNPIIFANIGTTMLGAIDNIDIIQESLSKIGIARGSYYLHADAALSGMILPFVENPEPFCFVHGIDSICVSGHKMIGCPMPCGVVIAKRHYVENIATSIDYITSNDKTISGSRNGHSVLLLWSAISKLSFIEWQKRIQHCISMADYVISKFQSFNINAWRNSNSITVVIPCPSKNIWQKHNLAVSGNQAHLIMLPHHKDTHQIDSVIMDIVNDLQNQSSFDCDSDL